jgi:hypothetical protein
MDEVVRGLWIGDLPSALDVKGLKERNIFSIVSAMRGKVTIHAVRITSATVAWTQWCLEEGSEAKANTETNRRSTSIKLTLMTARMKMSWCTFCHRYHLSRVSSTRVVVYSCIVKLELVRRNLEVSLLADHF